MLPAELAAFLKERLGSGRFVLQRISQDGATLEGPFYQCHAEFVTPAEGGVCLELSAIGQKPLRMFHAKGDDLFPIIRHPAGDIAVCITCTNKGGHWEYWIPPAKLD